MVSDVLVPAASWREMQLKDVCAAQARRLRSSSNQVSLRKW